MGKDTTAFRERFNAYKNGKSVSEIYDAGLPRYAGGTPTNTSWHNQAADLLDKFEGFRDSVYLDGKGIPTIGYGFTDPSLIKRGRISKPEARKILKSEIFARGNRLRSILGAERFDKLADSTKAALLSYYYNYPAGFADTTKLMKAWRNNDYREFVRLIDAGMNDSANPGLRDRRIEEQGLVLEDPFLFPKQIEEKSFVNTTAAKFNEENQFKPWSNYHQADYSLNNPAPSSISSWNNPNGPAFSTSQLYARRTNNNIEGVVKDILFNDKDADDALMDNLSKNVFGGRRLGFKNGKLPGYKDGIPTKVGEYNVYPSAVGASELNVTVPEVTVTGTDRRPMYQRYDAKNSTYDPNVIRNFTDLAPIIGDVGLGLDAYNAFKNLDYLLAGILGGSMLLPAVIEKPGKHLVRFGLNHFPELTKEIYDISKLYSNNVKDNPRLRKYANEVSDLLSSDKIRNRAFASGDMPNLMELSNIAKTPISFVHANRTFDRPIINLFGKEMLSPIPISKRYGGVYVPDKSIFIKRQNKTPNQIRQTTYHEASHAADKGKFVPAFYDKMKVEDWVSDSTSRYLGLPTEKRARIISILTDAQHNGVDIDNPEEIANFLSGYDNKNYKDLLFYSLGENTGSAFLDTVNTLLKGYKNGKLPIHIKPANRGKFTALKKRTGHSASWFKENGTPEQKKMAVFALNAKKWKH